MDNFESALAAGQPALHQPPGIAPLQNRPGSTEAYPPRPAPQAPSEFPGWGDRTSVGNPSTSAPNRPATSAWPPSGAPNAGIIKLLHSATLMPLENDSAR
eukprot:3440280-Pyramimonas_sp.AAC.1